MSYFCCCNCTWLNDTFQRAPTSGADGNRLGPNWNTTGFGGDWQIVNSWTGPSGHTYSGIGEMLVGSAVLGRLKCLVSPTTAPYSFTLNMYYLDSPYDQMPPDGSVLRLYLFVNAATGSISPYYIEWKTGTGGYVKVVGDETTIVDTVGGMGTSQISVCVEWNSDHTYSIIANSFAGQIIEVVAHPTGAHFTFEIISSPSAIVFYPIVGETGAMIGTNINNALCPGYCGCCDACPPLVEFNVEISGIANTGTIGICSNCPDINGTYIVPYTWGGCDWQSITTIPDLDDSCGKLITITITLSYDSFANQTTITFQLDALGGLLSMQFVEIVGGPMNCRSAAFETIKNTDEAAVQTIYVSACDTSDMVIAITSLWA